MFDNTNHYTLRTEIVEGIIRYYISFTDGQTIPREIEVSRPVYLEFSRFIKVERNLRRWDERHIEQADITEETLYTRALYLEKTVEDTAFDNLKNEQLRLAIQQLPEIQRRRFVLYHDFGLTYEQIADMEGCTKRAVKFSVDISVKKIREKLKNN